MRLGAIITCGLMIVGGAMITFGGGRHVPTPPDVSSLLSKALAETKEAKLSLLKDLQNNKASATAEEKAKYFAEKDMADFDRIWSPIADAVAGAIHNNNCGELAEEWSR